MNLSDIPPVGTKVMVTLKDIFGKPYEEFGRITKEPYQHGYHCKSGAWGLYSGEEPCYKIEFIPKGKRRAWVLDVKSIVSIQIA